MRPADAGVHMEVLEEQNAAITDQNGLLLSMIKEQKATNKLLQDLVKALGK